MDIALLMVGLIIGTLIYFAPACVASDKKQFKAILALNLLLGWTFLGWVIALVWALASPKQAAELLQARDAKRKQFQNHVPSYIVIPLALFFGASALVSLWGIWMGNGGIEGLYRLLP